MRGEGGDAGGEKIGGGEWVGMRSEWWKLGWCLLGVRGRGRRGQEGLGGLRRSGGNVVGGERWEGRRSDLRLDQVVVKHLQSLLHLGEDVRVRLLVRLTRQIEGRPFGLHLVERTLERVLLNEKKRRVR